MIDGVSKILICIALLEGLFVEAACPSCPNGRSICLIVRDQCVHDDCFETKYESLLLRNGYQCGTCKDFRNRNGGGGGLSDSANFVPPLSDSAEFKPPKPPTPRPPTPTPPSSSSNGARSSSGSPPSNVRICPDDSGPKAGYSLCLDLDVDVNDEYIFQRAANAWASKIVGDVEDVDTTGLRPANCGPYPKIIDDLYLCGLYKDMDGAGGVLGAAGPTHVRRSNGLPFAGEMSFDRADAARLRSSADGLQGVILHEMGHVLGIGTLWQSLGIQGKSNDCPYTGINVNREWRAMSGCNNDVPIELDGGSGTRCGHFDEVCLGREIMTGVIKNGNPIFSRLTIATIQDLGYTVNYNSAEPFGGNDIDRKCRCNRRNLRGNETNDDDEIPMMGNRRRKLSDYGLAKAKRFGKRLLHRATDDHANDQLSDDIIYVGGNFTNVIYYEDETVHFVNVAIDDDDYDDEYAEYHDSD